MLGVTQQSGANTAMEASSVCEAFQATVAAHPTLPAIRSLDGVVQVSWADYGQQVREAAAALAGLGLRPGETLGLMLSNRPEFHVVDAAAMHLGATPFSVYNTSSAEQIVHVAKDSGARLVVTERAFLAAVLGAQEGDSPIEQVIVVDGPADGARDWSEVLADAAAGFDFDAAWRAVRPDDIATLIYTSGTTGPPKGVQISHRNALAMARMLPPFVGLTHGTKVISALPMAHVAERMCSHYFPMALGLDVACCPNPREVVAALPAVRPAFFFSPPRLWEKIRASVLAGVAAEPDPARKAALQQALDAGMRSVAAQAAGDPVPADPQAELVLAALRAKLGFDDLRVALTGAAPCPGEVIEFIRALGVPLVEVYGLSETSGVATANPRDRVKIGSIGTPLPGVEVRLGEDGEIQVRGDLIMAGYRNLPDRTVEAIDPDGWFLTGDIGVVDEEGYYRIVDRKKELIISAAGKNMSPANIEAKLKVASPLIGQACAVGDRRPYNVALITLDPDGAAAFAKINGLGGVSPEALVARADVRAEVQAGVDRANEQMSRVEQVKKFALLGTDWEPDGDEMTPTMKLKRRNIMAKYATQIQDLYA